MTARIIDGKALSKQLREGFKTRVGALVAQGVTPGLAVILVGDNPASRVYVGNKVK
ncbi:tetrahydrofolate dehydrogenase/cyclohydrolase catalytic domain-containing protein, partial [Zoogloea sp.]